MCILPTFGEQAFSMKKHTDAEIETALATLPGWQHKNGALEKDFAFADFNAAFAFLARTALYSEKVNHHAEYSGVYNKVNLRLNTHDAGGITRKDVDFAKEADTYIS